jgi:membrane-bound lytic murein transglycosylase A
VNCSTSSSPTVMKSGNKILSSSFRSAVRFLFVLCTVLISGCASKLATGPHNAFREVSPPALSDDLALSGLQEAIEAQAKILKSTSTVKMQIGPTEISRAEYALALEQLAQILCSAESHETKLQYLRDRFRFFEFAGGDEPGKVLLTSYFEPTLRGSPTPTARLSRALYRKPLDLLSIPLSSFSERFKDEKALKARVVGDRVVPYFSREEIDGKGALREKGLELVWVDPIDAFFLQIQGSGTVVLPNGEEQHIVYSDKNGHRYEAVGKFLKSKIAPNKVTMQRVEAALRSMSPQERDKILFMNPSYVFFLPSKERAITSLGVPATPGRTIAVDPRFAPKGALVFLTFQKPTFSSEQRYGEDPKTFEEASRFVLDQDSGGAITGTGRVDLFWGRGDEAKRHAGVMQNHARVLYLVPR